MARRLAFRFRGLLPIFLLLAGPFAFAQVPGEVQGVAFDDVAAFSWAPLAGADFHQIYWGDLSDLRAGKAARCHGFQISGSPFGTPEVPQLGEGFYFLVTGESVDPYRHVVGNATSAASGADGAHAKAPSVRRIAAVRVRAARVTGALLDGAVRRVTSVRIDFGAGVYDALPVSGGYA